MKALFWRLKLLYLCCFLYFTFQRSELPCPKSADGLDRLKHLLVRHMEPFKGGTRWAVGTTKADPRAERLSGDAGPGREWIVVGEVTDDLFDMRVWLSHFYRMLPPGPRAPDSPFFVDADLRRPLTYRKALDGFRAFLGKGGCPNPELYGLHGVRAEAFVTCSGAVSDEAAVIQGGWVSRATASRYDRLTLAVAESIAPRMVAFHSSVSGGAVPPTIPEDSDDITGDADSSHHGTLSGASGLGTVAARAAARFSPAPRAAARPRAAHQPTNLPTGWTRVWHPTSGRRGGYASFVGPGGQKASTMKEIFRIRGQGLETRLPSAPIPPSNLPAAAESLCDYVVYDSRPSTRRAPTARVRA